MIDKQSLRDQSLLDRAASYSQLMLLAKACGNKPLEEDAANELASIKKQLEQEEQKDGITRKQ